jgi:hypothetical protein
MSSHGPPLRVSAQTDAPPGAYRRGAEGPHRVPAHEATSSASGGSTGDRMNIAVYAFMEAVKVLNGKNLAKAAEAVMKALL